MHESSPGPVSGPNDRSNRLSYKFQRLREQLRSAVVSGALGTRLPGERELGKRFGANAKTINKALRDLTSEGLLVRQIGRGTFVASSNAPELTRHKSIQCLKRVAAPSPVGRSALLDAVRTELQTLGHALEVRQVDAPAHQPMQISAWPSAIRTGTDGLLIQAGRPLSGQSERLSDDLIEESYRRHTPTVVLGSCSGDAKLNAVVPDYTEAGFRICDHLVRMGCQFLVVVSSAAGSREDELVVTGARSAAMRHDVSLHHIVLPRCADGEILDLIGAAAEASKPKRRAAGPMAIGLIAIGRPALESIRTCEGAVMKDQAASVLKGCILDADDPSAAPDDWTSYEIDLPAMARWTAKLVLDARPGLRPAEVLVPGSLRLMRRHDSGSSNGNGNGRHAILRMDSEPMIRDAVAV